MTQTVSQDSAGFASWMNATTSNRTQITATVYDQPAWNMAGLMTQQNLRNRVSFTYTKNNATDGNFYTASYYTYDVHGNVDTLIQDYLYVPGMSTTPYKRICYDYDLVSGKVNGVDYQPGATDAFYYRYQYDAENRLTNVLTSRDSITWEQDASYLYYKHGPLSRTVLGQLQTQGIDYTYTLQGWLKGVNIGNGYGAAVVDSSGSFCAAGSALSDVVVTSRSVTDTPYTYTARSSVTFDSGFETYDGDSLQTNINDSLAACNLPASGGDTASASGLSEAYPVAQDAYSFSLHYYPGDYNAIGATTPVTDVLTTLGSQASPLFNGNIAASALILPGGLRPQVYSYQYDQLNRLVQMKVDTGLNAATHTFTPVQLPDYGERVAYDPNGNINGYVRHGYGAHIPMDSLTYHYYANTNQLQRINDSAGGSYTTDLKDQGTGTNYTYDLNGQLKKDVTNQVSNIDWTVYGKIADLANDSGTITYTYDAAGNRITKTVSGTNTIYVRDAQGNILAIYTQSGSGAPLQTEVDLYGSSRLGSVRSLTVAPTSISLSGGYSTAYLSTFSRGEKSYELTNHLGNVLSTITDKKIAVSSTTDSSLIDHFTADVATAQDYYPFGMLMPGRTFPGGSGPNYRYGFNGKEQDPEVEGTGNFYDYGMRGYDPRIGRFPSVDPLTKKYPELTPYQYASNTPIQDVDLDGMEGGSYLNDLNGARSRMQLLTAAVLKLPKSQTATTIHDYLRMHPQQATNQPNSDRVESTEGALFRANVNDPDNIGGQAAYAIANNLHDATVDFKEGNFGSGTLDLLNATTNIVTLTGAGPALGVDVNTEVKTGAPFAENSISKAKASEFIRTETIGGNKAARTVGANIKIINEGGSLAPIEVADINNKLYVINGHHRLEAALRTNTEIRYKVLSKDEWQKYGYKSESEVIGAASEVNRVKLDDKLVKKAAGQNQ